MQCPIAIPGALQIGDEARSVYFEEEVFRCPGGIVESNAGQFEGLCYDGGKTSVFVADDDPFTPAEDVAEEYTGGVGQACASCSNGIPTMI